MFEGNYNPADTPAFQVLSEEKVGEIHRKALYVLEKIGCVVESETTCGLLKKAGARVDGTRVKLPSHIVEACLRLVPKGFCLYGRDGKSPLHVEGRKVYFGSSWASQNTIDPFSHEVRPTQVKDIAQSARVADALDNIDFVTPMGTVQEVGGLAGELYEFEAVVKNSRKPICFISKSVRGLEIVYEMAAAVAGGMDQLREKPFLIPYPQPITPLYFPEDICEKLLLCARLGMPTMCSPCSMAGATAPTTLAGTLVLTTAESLMGLVISQLRTPGTPFLFGGTPSIIDMKTGNMCIAPPESSILISAQADIARFYKIPTWGTAGTTEAKTLDAEAGIEGCYSILTQALAGCNLIHDLGYMDMASCNSLEMLVMDDEIVGMVKRLLEGIAVTPDTLAVDEIELVGPKGNFLQSAHTFSHFKTEFWQPTLLARESMEGWKKKGSKTMGDKIQEKIKTLIDTHRLSELDSSVVEEIEYLKRKGEKELA